jgi:hypothetical protein
MRDDEKAVVMTQNESLLMLLPDAVARDVLRFPAALRVVPGDARVVQLLGGGRGGGGGRGEQQQLVAGLRACAELYHGIV